jgi:hypothetical protein
MAWDLATAKVKVGGTYSDAEITLAMDMTEDVIEKYCDRIFIQETADEQTLNFYSWQTQVKHYPISSITDITLDGISVDPTTYTVDQTRGAIQFNTVIYAKSLLVSLIGGYATLPYDLELAFWQVFGEVWMLQTATLGASTQTIKAMKIDGVGQVTYDTGATAATTNGIQGLITEVAAGILEPYKATTC